MDKAIVYRVPPQEPSLGRVYTLPEQLVRRVHEYGFANGHQSEVSAIRALLEAALAKELSNE